MQDNSRLTSMICWILLLPFICSVPFTEGIASDKLNNNNYFDQLNCTLVPEKNNMQIKLDKLIKEDNRLIQLDVTVNWNSQPTNVSFPQYKSWFLTTDDSGKHLLMLDENFVAMSLGTLSYGIAEMHIRFKQEPEDCLGNMTGYSAEKLLQFSLLALPAKSSDYIDEDGFSPFSICTGSMTSNGTCCSLNLLNNTVPVKCSGFREDDWISHFVIIMMFFAIFAISHCTYLIPKSLYETNETIENETYLVKDMYLRLLIVKGHTFQADENWLQMRYNMVPFLKTIVDHLMKRSASKRLTGERQKRDSDITYTVYNICTDNESMTKRSDELVSEISTSHSLLHSLRKTLNDIRNTELLRPYCYGQPFSNCVRFTEVTCWNVLRTVFITFLCLTPFIFTVTVITRSDFFLGSFQEAVFMGCAISFLLCLLLGLLQCNRNDRSESWFVKSLQEINQQTPEEIAKDLLLTLLSPITRFGYCGVILTPFSFIISLFYLVIRSLPLLYFSCISYKDYFVRLSDNREVDWCCFSMMPVVVLIWFSAVFITLCVTFYTTCLAYFFLGLFLNFDQLFDVVLLIALVFTYALHCINSVYEKMDIFNQKVFENVRELCSNAHDVYARALEGKINIAKKMLSRDNVESIASARLFVENDKIIMRPKGLYLYYKYHKTDRLPYMHIAESFLDQLASEPGQLTPGSKYFLLFSAFKEMIIVLIAAIAMFLTIHGVGNKNDTNTIIHNLVTVGGSGTLMFFIKNFSKSKGYKKDGYQMQFKTLINRHLNTSPDSFEWTDVTDNSCMLQDSMNNLKEFPNFSDYDVVINVFETESGQETINACYLKKLPNDDIEPCRSFCCTRCSKCCRNNYDVL